MPSCPPTCPKVKRNLKKLAAERKRALEGRPGPGPDKSTELEEEINNYEYSVDESLSKSARSRSGKSYKSTEVKSLCSRSGRNFKTTGSDFEDSDFEKINDDKPRDQRCGERQCFQMVEDLPRTKRRDRRRNREEYESDESEDYISPSRKPCTSEYSSKKLKDEAIKRKQKDPDDYHPNKGINYFDDLCYCSSLCLAKKLWSKTCFRKLIVSVALFGVGLKLCYNFDGWQVQV